MVGKTILPVLFSEALLVSQRVSLFVVLQHESALPGSDWKPAEFVRVGWVLVSSIFEEASENSGTPKSSIHLFIGWFHYKL